MTSDLYWKCGLTCIFIPGILFLMWMIYLYCSGREEFSWSHLGLDCLAVLLYPVLVIGSSLYGGWRTIRGRSDEEDTRVTKQFKLMEVIGE